MRRLRLTLTLESGPALADQILFGPGHGLVLALLRHLAPAESAELHDADRRKPFSAGPLRVAAAAGRPGEARLDVRCWDPQLGEQLEDAARTSLDASLHIAGRPAAVLSVDRLASATLEELLAPPHRAPVWVRFETPAFFGFGRWPGGAQRIIRQPLPGLVAGSWLYAWRQAGGPLFGIPEGSGLRDWLGERIDLLAMHGLRTRAAPGAAVQTAGFVGTVGFRWAGPEPWGPALLTALARFSAYSGTGAKTGHGFGETWCLESGNG